MIEAVDWREYDAFFASTAPAARRRRRAGDAGDRRARRELRPAQAPHRLHQGRDLPRRLPPVGRRAHDGGGERNGLALRRRSTTSACTTARRCGAGGPTSTGSIPTLPALGLDDRFARLWDFYFAYCEAGFDERYISVTQLRFATVGAWLSAASATPRRLDQRLRGGGRSVTRRHRRARR